MKVTRENLDTVSYHIRSLMCCLQSLYQIMSNGEVYPDERSRMAQMAVDTVQKYHGLLESACPDVVLPEVFLDGTFLTRVEDDNAFWNTFGGKNPFNPGAIELEGKAVRLVSIEQTGKGKRYNFETWNKF